MNKRKIRYNILFLFLFLSCNNTKHIVSKEDNSQYSLYRITKIKEYKSYYLVYANRNDSVFKIISNKESIYSSGEKIRSKRQYDIELRKIFPDDSIFGIPMAPNLEIRGIGMSDGTIVNIEEKSHNTLYSADNLDGVYLKK
jgi:hypothetical protein